MSENDEDVVAMPQSSEDSNKHELEHYRLAGRSPLITVLYLSFGPVLSQIASAMYGVIDTIWISKAVGEIGMTAVSSYTAFDNIGRAFGFFASVAGSSKISALFGSGKSQEASQVICDLLRVCIVSGIIVPLILGPLIKPGVRWFGASEEVVELGFGYLFPLLLSTVFTCWFVGCGGFLQGEGRSLMFGFIQIASLVCNMAIFDPIFLLWFKLGLKGAAYARIISEAIPAIILISMYFSGKFAVKPKLSQLLKPFSEYTWQALKVGMSQLVSNLSVSIPGIIVRKYIGMSSSSTKMFNDSLAGFNVVFRYAQVTNNLMVGLSMGFLPAGSYAYAAKNYRRWFSLQFHMNWIDLVWGSLASLLAIFSPQTIAIIFAKGEGYLYYAREMVRRANIAGFIMFARFGFPVMLQSLQLGITSTILSLATQLVSIIAFVSILYYTDKNNPVRLMWCYSWSYIFGFVVGGIVVSKPLYRMYKEMIASEAEDRKSEGSGGNKEPETGSFDEL